jgi:formamidopyrimidine-DNA glycosylase
VGSYRSERALAVPELPEVEVVRRGIVSHLVGARIDDVRIFDIRALKRHQGSAESFRDALTGATVLAAVRRGKFVWCPLDSGAVLVAHLGMSGQFRVPGSEPLRHERVRLVLAGRPDFSFVDQRLFGSLAVDTTVTTADGFPGGAGSDSPLLAQQVAHIARDVLDVNLDVESVIASMRRRSVGVKVALLNQSIVSGVGNIYADEALWAAGIHYLTPANRVTAAEYRDLFAHCQRIMSAALDAGGTSFDELYVNVNGESGYFDLSLHAYGQQGKPCGRCGAPIERAKWQNRSSHFCPVCQRVR